MVHVPTYPRQFAVDRETNLGRDGTYLGRPLIEPPHSSSRGFENRGSTRPSMQRMSAAWAVIDAAPSVVAVDRELLGVAAEGEPGRVAAEEIGPVHPVEPARALARHETHLVHRVAQDAAEAHRVLLEARQVRGAGKAVDLAVHPRAQLGIQRSQLFGIDRVVEGATHVLEKELRR